MTCATSEQSTQFAILTVLADSAQRQLREDHEPRSSYPPLGDPGRPDVPAAHLFRHLVDAGEQRCERRFAHVDPQVRLGWAMGPNVRQLQDAAPDDRGEYMAQWMHHTVTEAMYEIFGE